MNFRCALLAMASALTLATTARAELVTYNFGGFLDGGAGVNSLVAGDSFAGSFSFESTAGPVFITPGYFTYNDGFSFNVTLKSLYRFDTVSPIPLNAIQVGWYRAPDPPSGIFTVTSRDSAGIAGPVMNSDTEMPLTPDTMSLSLFDRTGKVINGPDLPTSLNLSDFDSLFSLRLVAPSGFGDATLFGSLSYLTLASAPAVPVPEASTSAMLALGLGALIVATRRRKSA
jgi:hypothetical protein